MLLKLWGVRLHGIVKCVGLPRLEIDPKGKVYVGRHVCLRSARCSNIAGVFQPVSIGTLDGGRIELGDGCGISGSTLVASREIRIGKKRTDRSRMPNSRLRFSPCFRRGAHSRRQREMCSRDLGRRRLARRRSDRAERCDHRAQYCRRSRKRSGEAIAGKRSGRRKPGEADRRNPQKRTADNTNKKQWFYSIITRNGNEYFY